MRMNVLPALHLGSCMIGYVLLLGCGCTLSSDDDVRFKRAVESAGGTASTASIEVLRTYGAPANLSDRITFIDMAGSDSGQINIMRLVPADSVVSLRLYGCDVSDEQVGLLQHCKHLAEIDLTASGISDAALESLATIDTLQTLILNGCNVTDKGLLQLQTCRNLKDVFAINTHITRKGMKDLVNSASSLESVGWSPVPSEPARRAVAGLIRAGAYVNAGGAYIRVLKHVDEKDVVADDEDLRFAIGFTEEWRSDRRVGKWLAELSRHGNIGVTLRDGCDDIFASFSEDMDVCRLELDRDASASARNVRCIAQLSSLKSLTLYEVDTTEIAFELLSEVKGLRELNLQELTMSGSWISLLADCAAIQTVDIRSCDLKGDPFEAEDGFRSLKSITLINCRGVDKESLGLFRQAHPDVEITIK